MPVRSSIRITQKVATLAKSKEARYEIWDAELPGFALRVETSGNKSFIIRYRAEGGGRTAPRRLLTLGHFGPLTVDEARKQAKKLLGGVASGADPAGERHAKRKEMTVANLIKLYEAEGTSHLREKTRRYTIARLRNHVLPLIGQRRVADIRIPDIERFIHEVGTGKSQRDDVNDDGVRIIVKGGTGASAKVVRDLSSVLSFAVRREIIPSNPCSRVRKPADKQRHRFLSPDEMKRLGDCLKELEGAGVNPKAISIIRLLILTGCRRDEIAALEWEEVDFERQRLVLRDSKTGRSIRPLGPSALSLLQSVPRSENARYVFPAERGPGHFQGTRKLWPVIRQKANLPGITNHTLRHSFGSAAASAGESLLMVGALLGHANYRSTSIYAHLQASSQQESAKRLSKILDDAL